MKIQNEPKSKVPTGIIINEYTDFEFRIYKTLIGIFIVVVYKNEQINGNSK